jgi:RNA 3'-terminal phosphate cyclase (ATP)
LEEEMLTIDGSFGEGGGQVVRTSIALSAATGQPVRIENVRAGRRRPGLMRQHLTAVEAAAAICGAEVEGAEVGSRALTFRPGSVRAGDHLFSVGTAGSATLVLQTVLPSLLLAPGASRLVLEGGTHNPLAPPFDFLERVFVPLINRMGPRVSVRLERPGFYPAGGGRFTVDIEPASRLVPLQLTERGEIRDRRARALVANLSPRIAQRELAVVREQLGWDEGLLRVEQVRGSPGPGNALLIEIGSEHVTELFAGFGERGVAAEAVAAHACREAQRYLAAGVPVGEHLADQLVIPFALAGGGAFRTLALSRHTTTQLELVPRFLPVSFRVSASGDDVVEVRAATTA